MIDPDGYSVHTPTDAQCLRAAVRAYQEHIDLRPAHHDEAMAIAAGHDAQADASDAAVAACRAVGPVPAADRGHFRDLGCHHASRQALMHSRSAAIHRSHADEWRRVSPGTHGQVADVLRERVRHYAGLSVSDGLRSWALRVIA